MLAAAKDIAVFFDAGEDGHRLLDAAARFAAERGARVIGIWAAEGDVEASERVLAQDLPNGSAVGGQQGLLGTRLLRVGRSLARVAANYGINAEFRVIPSDETGSTAALRSLYCDLLFVGYPEAPGLPFAWTYAELLEQTDEPLLIVPRSWKGSAIGRRITVAWSASHLARRAFAAALPLLVSAQSVDLLIVDAESGPLPYDHEPGAEMAAYLGRLGVQVDMRPITSQCQSFAEKIVARAREHATDLIVFGADRRSRDADAIFGSVTRRLLAEVPLPLFVSG